MTKKQKHLDDEVNKEMERMSDVLQQYWKTPDVYIKMLCDYHRLDFDKYMDEYLDIYSLILKQQYQQMGENYLTSQLREMYMQEALYRAVYKIGDDINKRDRRDLFEQITNK